MTTKISKVLAWVEAQDGTLGAADLYRGVGFLRTVGEAAAYLSQLHKDGRVARSSLGKPGRGNGYLYWRLGLGPGKLPAKPPHEPDAGALERAEKRRAIVARWMEEDRR